MPAEVPPSHRPPTLIAGHHEPLMFRRRGGWVRDGAAEYHQEQTRENAMALRALGVGWVRVHYFKGFGLAAEAEELEEGRQWIELLHEVGLRAETYLQFSNVMYETFLLERPEAMEWIQRTQEGEPNRLCYGHQAWRYLMCYNSPEWEGYLRDVVRMAVLEAHADRIAWDNCDINITPDFCHCPRCCSAFRDFLSTRYADVEARTHRYGFTDFRCVEPPVYNRWNPVLELREVRDPLIQDWVDFVATAKAAQLRRLSDHGRGLRRDLTVNCNGIKGPAENLAFTRGLDIAGMCGAADIIGSEEHHYPHIRKDGALITNIRTKKRCAAFGVTAESYVYVSDRALRLPALAFAESAAFDLMPSARMGILERRSADEKWRVWDFLREHAALLAGRVASAGRIAVLRGAATMRHSRVEPYLVAMQVEQVLIQNHCIFQMIEDPHLADLSRYRLLILPQTESLGDRETGLIRDFVRGGGGLLCVGEVGRYDEWRRPLAAPRFSYLVPRGLAEGKPWKATYGQGTVVWVPSVTPDAATVLDREGGGLGLTEDCFALPANERMILQAMATFGAEVRGIRVRAPKTVAAEWWEHEDGSRTLHLVNYDPKARPRGIRLSVPIDPGRVVGEVVQYAPELREPKRLEVRVVDDGYRVRVPTMDLYTVLAYTLEPESKAARRPYAP